MNYWTELSIQYANQRSYLDDLFQVYPTIPEGIRDIDPKQWEKVEIAFASQDNFELISHLLKLKKFPLKNSYVSFLRKDLNGYWLNSQRFAVYPTTKHRPHLSIGFFWFSTFFIKPT